MVTRLASLFDDSKKILEDDKSSDSERDLAKKLENALHTILALKESRNIKIWGIGLNGGQSDAEIVEYINKEDQFLIDLFFNKKG